jgi:hypothetical protein
VAIIGIIFFATFAHGGYVATTNRCLSVKIAAMPVLTPIRTSGTFLQRGRCRFCVAGRSLRPIGVGMGHGPQYVESPNHEDENGWPTASVCLH